MAVFIVCVVYVVAVGVGIWGIQIPNAWSFAITDFVWWIGIGHAGTLISAFLLLMHQKWRTSINRIAEAMTIFAVMCAGMFPLLHLGRPWFFYWLLPYSNTMQLWPQFRSALVYDVFAVSTYFTVSLLFWYMGMIPDLATLRDRAAGRISQLVYGMLALGWRNSARHWKRFETAYLLLAGLATPLVISVHSVVSSDFAISVVPAWHETVFPPYFVAGAIFSGFAMVLLLCVPIRHLYHLKDFITLDHLDVMAKLVLATSLLTSFGYLSEQTLSWYAGDTVEWYTYWFRISGFGQYAYITWFLFFCNTIAPQILWIKPLRRKETVLVAVSLADPGGHVAGTLHDHHHQPQPRLSAVVVGLLQADDLGHPHLRRIGGGVSDGVSPVRPLRSDHVDVGDAGLAARCARAGGGTMKDQSPLYGLLAEFLTAQEVLDGHAPGAAGRLSATWTPIRLTRSRAWRRSWACGRRGCPSSC